MNPNHYPSVASSCCSDLREMNEMKVNNILSYLDAVDTHQSDPSHMRGPIPAPQSAYAAPHQDVGLPPTGHQFYKDPAQRPTSVQQRPSSMHSTVSQLTNISSNQQTFNGIKSKLDNYKQQTEVTAQENAMLKERLEQQKLQHNQRLDELQKKAQIEVDTARKEAATNAKSSHSKLTRLVEEKEKLTECVEKLTGELKKAKEAHHTDVSRLEKDQTTALSELKTKWAAQERVKREQWALKEAKKIKEATLKAVEPDIALMMNRQKAEKARLMEEHQLDIKQRDEQLVAKDKELLQQKMKISREFEELLEREARMCREKVAEANAQADRRVENAKQEFAEKKTSLDRFHEEQRAALRAEIKAMQDELFSVKATLTEDQAKFRGAVDAEVDRIVAAKEIELAQQKAKLEQELGRRATEQTVHQQELLDRRADEIRSKCIAERDAAIAKVVAHLEEEHTKSQAQRRDEMKTLRDKCSTLENSVERLGTDLQIKSDQIRRLTASLQEKEQENEVLSRQLAEAKGNTDAAIRYEEAEFAKRLRQLDGEWQLKHRRLEGVHVDQIAQLQQELAQAKRSEDRVRGELEAEMRNVEQQHNAELSNVNDRVLLTISKRDTVIQQLQQHVAHLEAVLVTREQELQQHRELLDDDKF